MRLRKRTGAEPESFKIGPEFLNEALAESTVEGITMTKTRQGQLYLDTEMSGEETIDALISAIAMLYSKLRLARLGIAEH